MLVEARLDADQHYARLRTHLEKQGTRIGANDTLIAEHMLAIDAALITHDVSEFARVPALRLMNWLR